VPRLRPLCLLVALAATSVLLLGAAPPPPPEVSSLSSSPVTVYGAKWCSACRSLERGLTDRKIAFEVIDVDDNPAAFAKARAAANAGGAIPLTGIVRTSNTVWVVGADVEAVDRAQRGE
jgi:glutaredoxin